MHCNSTVDPLDLHLAMKTGLLIFSFFHFLMAHADSNCIRVMSDCSYYSCVSDTLKCQENNYLKSFGEKYCSLFKIKKSEFSIQNQNFFKRVSQCLRNKIEVNMEELSCSNIKSAAAFHHEQCYLASGFCRLSLTDQYQIFQTILRPILFDKTFQRVARRIFIGCRL